MAYLSKYRPLTFLAILFVLGALLKPVAASQQEAATVEVMDQYGSAAVTLYFLDQAEEYLIPVSRRVEDEAGQTPRRALEELLAGPEAGPLIPFFEIGTEILEFSVSGVQATIELSMPDGVDQLRPQAMDAVRWTLTEFPEIDAISLTVNGWGVDAEGNFGENAISLGQPESINSHLSASGQPVQLYFGYADDPSLLVPVTVYIDTPNGDVNAQLTQTVEQLLLGPSAGSNLVSTIPSNVNLLAASMAGVVANVDFSEDLVIAYRLKEANALHVRKAVIATITSLPDVYAGAIEIGGSSLLYFTCQNVVMEHPQAKPWAINDEFYM